MNKMSKTYLLKEICSIDKGKQIDTDILDDTLPYKYINGGIKESGYYNDYNINGETILISEGGASCGYINYVNEKIWHGCHCYALSNSKVLPKYLFYALKSNQHRIMALRTGAAMPNIKKTTLQNIELSLHEDTKTQKKIADELDKITSLIEKRKSQIEKLDLLTKAKFAEMFGDPVVNEMGWEKDKLSILGELGRGVSKHRPRNDPKLLNGDYPLIQTGEVANANLYINTYTNTYSDLGLKQSKMWKKGTLCITIAANIAKTAILTFDACFPDSVVGFSSNERTNQMFVHFWFAFFQQILEAQAPESAQKNINLKILSDLDVITPPLSLQNKFAEYVEKIEKTRYNMEKGLAQLEVLYKERMQSYFG